MDKNAIKKYAVWARRELIERVSQRAMIYGITAKDAGDPNAESVNGHLLSQAERRQRQALIRNIKTKSYEQVMEEVAYTWFNRFAALRFMEVNGYLPSHIRVFTNDAGEFKPQILAEAIHLELEGLDMNKVYDLESANKSEELFKYLLIVQCNALNNILPGMFQRIEDYTELLLPDYLLREGSVIEQMVTTIPEKDWTDQVQIIGWLYQYYCIEPFNALYDGDKATDKITSDELPSATQLFTPDWIVHYMVENSLGRLWLEGHPNDTLKSEWKYYLDEAEQEPEVQVQLATIRKEYAALKPEEIRVIDPCMGSGHILCVLFDILVRIYEDYGYTAREAAVKIVENNLWGLDIDERASQLSYFAVMMKARQYDRRFLTRNVQPHVYAIHETNSIKDDYNHAKHDFGLKPDCLDNLGYLMETFIDAKEYGSIIPIAKRDYSGLKEAWSSSEKTGEVGNTLSLWSVILSPEIPHLINQAITMAQKYHVVVTNPPYLNANRMNAKLTGFVAKKYKESKQDLSMIMYQAVCNLYLERNGLVSFITPTSWMFSAKFKAIREKVVSAQRIVSICDCGTELFDGKVGHLYIGAWVSQNHRLFGISRFVNVSSYCYSRRDEKPEQFHNPENRGLFRQSDFSYLPDMPMAYDMDEHALRYFQKGITLGDAGSARQGLTTSDNRRFTRSWYEVVWEGICLTCNDCEETKENGMKWYPFLKGGAFQKWYQRFDTVVNYENDGFDIKRAVMQKYTYLNNPGFVVKNTEWYFKTGLCWNDVGGERFNARLLPSGYIFADASPSFFPNDNDVWFYLAYFNSAVFQGFANTICQGLHYSTGQIPKIPVELQIPDMCKDQIRTLAHECYDIVAEAVNENETSIGFIRHTSLFGFGSLRKRYTQWEDRAKSRFKALKEKEEAINRLFAQAYNMNAIDCNISDSDVSVSMPNQLDYVKSLLSYAVGCILGRYSLDVEGIAYGGGDWNTQKYATFLPDKDAIIPICDDEYFDDDIVGCVIRFIDKAFGHTDLEDNLLFIAETIGGKGTSRDVIRNYFINDFYSDHCNMYSVTGSGKRPIYWLFDSGKKNGFKCLIYMHRYQPDTIARIRTDYVHEQQSRYRTAIADLEQRINGASTSERVKLSKRLATLQAQAEEIRVYEEKIHHLADQMIKIDLDDGVKHNYEIFKDVLAKIK